MELIFNFLLKSSYPNIRIMFVLLDINPFPTVSVKLTDSVVFTYIFLRVLE